MMRRQYILKYKGIILCIGILIASAIVIGPIAQNIVADQHVSKEIKSDKDEDQENDFQVSSLEAVAQVVHGNLIPVQKITEELEVFFQDTEEDYFSFVLELPGKLFNILFRTIISPNAP